MNWKKFNLRKLQCLFVLFSFYYVKLHGFHMNMAVVEEAQLEATKLIALYGYPSENHTIVTRDGYELVLHRIPGRKGDNLTTAQNRNGTPALLMHGLLCESMQWFDSGPNSLAFVLADQGYDVWTGNFRGSEYSKHIKWLREEKEFWNYKLDDHVMVDLPAIIDYILANTSEDKLVYIGQSMGTLVAFLTLAENVEYNDKISILIALGPVLAPKYMSSPFIPIIKLLRYPAFRLLMRSVALNTFAETTENDKRMTYRMCPSDSPWICEIGLNLINGYDPYLVNTTRVPVYGSHCGTGTAWKNFLQLSQLVFKDVPSKFDYGGKRSNQLHYKSFEPPKYNVSNVVVPVVLFYGANDPIANPLNVVLLARQLRNVIGLELIKNPFIAHGDYMWAVDAKELIYDKIIHYVNNFTRFDFKL